MTVHWIGFRWRAEGTRKRARNPIAFRVRDEIAVDVQESAFFRPSSVLDWIKDDYGPIFYQEAGQLYRRLPLEGALRQALELDRQFNPLGFLHSDRQLEIEIAADLPGISQILKSDREDAVRELTRTMSGAVLQTRQGALYLPCRDVVMSVVAYFEEGKPAGSLSLRPEIDPYWAKHGHWVDERLPGRFARFPGRFVSVPFACNHAPEAYDFTQNYLGEYQRQLRRFPRNPMEIHPLVDRIAEAQDRWGYRSKPMDGYEPSGDAQESALRGVAHRLSDWNMQRAQMEVRFPGTIVECGETSLPSGLLRMYAQSLRSARGYLDGKVEAYSFAATAEGLSGALRDYADNHSTNPWAEEFACLYSATIDATLKAYPALIEPGEDEDVDLGSLSF